MFRICVHLNKKPFLRNIYVKEGDFFLEFFILSFYNFKTLHKLKRNNFSLKNPIESTEIILRVSGTYTV